MTYMKVVLTPALKAIYFAETFDLMMNVTIYFMNKQRLYKYNLPLMTFALVFKLVHVLVLIVNKYICIILSFSHSLVGSVDEVRQSFLVLGIIISFFKFITIQY
jgi:hypothetical protein